jgi:hypothetical protein
MVKHAVAKDEMPRTLATPEIPERDADQEDGLEFPLKGRDYPSPFMDRLILFETEEVLARFLDVMHSFTYAALMIIGGDRSMFNNAKAQLKLGQPLFVIKRTGGAASLMAEVLRCHESGEELHPESGEELHQSGHEAKLLSKNFPENYRAEATLVVDPMTDKPSELLDKMTQTMSSVFTSIPALGGENLERERLMEAWEQVVLFQYNARFHKRTADVLEFLILLFGFLSTVAATVFVQYRMHDTDDATDSGIMAGPPKAGEKSYPLHIVNIILPSLVALFLALNSEWKPLSKFATLLMCQRQMESEIFAYCCRAGAYARSGRTLDIADADKGGIATGTESERLADSQPEEMFASAIRDIWNRIAESDLQESSLVTPPNIGWAEMARKDETVARTQTETVARSLHISQSALKHGLDPHSAELVKSVWDGSQMRLSADDYMNVRLRPLLHRYQKQARSLARPLHALQFGVFLSAFASTLAAAFGYTAVVPCIGALAAAFSGWLSFSKVEARLGAVNNAIYQLNKLLTFWGGLSLIHKRLPVNMSVLIETCEAAAMAELSSYIAYVQAAASQQGGGNASSSGGAEHRQDGDVRGGGASS